MLKESMLMLPYILVKFVAEEIFTFCSFQQIMFLMAKILPLHQTHQLDRSIAMGDKKVAAEEALIQLKNTAILRIPLQYGPG